MQINFLPSEVCNKGSSFEVVKILRPPCVALSALLLFGVIAITAVPRSPQASLRTCRPMPPRLPADCSLVGPAFSSAKSKRACIVACEPGLNRTFQSHKHKHDFLEPEVSLSYRIDVYHRLPVCEKTRNEVKGVEVIIAERVFLLNFRYRLN